MLRHQVCIVLNERESTKAAAAETLLQLLNAKNITASRVEVDSSLVGTLKERNPQVVVIDYLLGDFTTGLDVMEQLEKIDAKFLFLTDEPSVPVAVQAMRLGALNYLQLENPQSLFNVVQEVESVLVRTPALSKKKAQQATSLSELVADAPKSAEMVKAAKTAALHPNPVIVLFGPRGSGRSLLARCIHKERNIDSPLREIDLDLFAGDIGDLIGHTKYGRELLSLGSNLSIFVDHADADNGEFLSVISEKYSDIWGHPPDNDPAETTSFLIVGCSSRETLDGWKRLTRSSVIELPSLSERTADFAPLVQRFTSQASELVRGKIKPLDPQLVLELSKRSWPGEISELRGVIIDALLTNSHSGGEMQELIDSACERWESENSEMALSLDPFVVARTVEDAAQSIRVAAARLGCTTAQVRQALREGMLNGGDA